MVNGERVWGSDGGSKRGQTLNAESGFPSTILTKALDLSAMSNCNQIFFAIMPSKYQHVPPKSPLRCLKSRSLQYRLRYTYELRDRWSRCNRAAGEKCKVQQCWSKTWPNYDTTRKRSILSILTCPRKKIAQRSMPMQMQMLQMHRPYPNLNRQHTLILIGMIL